MTDKYKDWIVRYYANHDDIPEGQSDGHIVRELIRCKECKHHWDDDRCEMMSNMIETDDDWWCADGERRTDNG